MIKIISESNDVSTNEVIEYLIAYNVDFKRENSDTFSNYSYTISNDLYDNENPVIWHRRSVQQLNPVDLMNYSFSYHLWNENDVVNKFYEKLNKQDKKYIGGFIEENQHNKLYDLHLAKLCGFKIPETLITNKKTDLVNFKKRFESIITKPFKDLIKFKDNNSVYSSQGTFIVKDHHIKELDEYFAVSKFQEYIEKELEIRVFCFDKRIFAMAIFSQNDERTKVDFRNYNLEKESRNISFKLPNNIVSKIKKILKNKEINTCSIDLILTPDNEFVFLEINPQGQFGWVSKNCNYYVEKYIAETLINYERNS